MKIFTRNIFRSIIQYFKISLERKKARRFFRHYPYVIHSFHLEHLGKIHFANWQNPLVKPFTLTDAEMNFWQKFVNPGSLALDIGSNIGDTTVPMALAAGREGMTLGFDPNPHVFRILEKNASMNKDKTNIIPYPYAITSEDCEVSYHSSEASFANGGISTDGKSRHGKFRLPKKVKGIDLVRFLKSEYRHWLSRLSLIKIDAEGHDVEIIKSIASLFHDHKPALVGEFFQKYDLPQREVLFNLVSEMDYNLFYFYDFPDQREVFRITPENLDRPEIFNFYALPRRA